MTATNYLTEEEDIVKMECPACGEFIIAGSASEEKPDAVIG
jgi:predicted RNA-binding Zn-ribbon protein involved in translation (DUF1610 family)